MSYIPPIPVLRRSVNINKEKIFAQDLKNTNQLVFSFINIYGTSYPITHYFPNWESILNMTVQNSILFSEAEMINIKYQYNNVVSIMQEDDYVIKHIYSRKNEKIKKNEIQNKR